MRCACFSLCTDAEAHAFVSALPPHAAAGSPWHDYLRAVYGEHPPPDTPLGNFSHFYHAHAGWPTVLFGHIMVWQNHISVPAIRCPGRKNASFGNTGVTEEVFGWIALGVGTCNFETGRRMAAGWLKCGTS